MNEISGKRIVAIIQARMGSERLPGKSLKKIVEKPLLQLELERVAKATQLDAIVVATTAEAEDDPIAALCRSLKIPTARGSSNDVLDRYYHAAKNYEAEVIVRITGDCPLIDPAIIDQVITFYLDNIPKYDYVSNTEARTFPRGMDVEVFAFKALEKAFTEAKKPAEREHVTPYIYQNRKLFNLGLVMRGTNEAHLRLTVDTKEDFELVTKIYEALYPKNPDFTLENILELLKERPDLEKINAHIEQKKL